MAQPSRRQFLSGSVAALSVSLSGCSRDDLQNQPATETPTPAETEPGCWPSMCAGTQLIEVDVSSAVSGTIELAASCRDDPLSVRSGESVQLVREEDGEECGVTLSIDDKQVYDERIGGNESVTLTVRPDGNVDEERVVL